MKRELIVIGGREEIVGYKLAGVEKVLDMDDEGAVDDVAGSESLIFLTHDAYERYGQRLSGGKPIVFEMPQKGIPYTRLGDIIRDTIGFDLRK